jgi:hypothetical protein
MELENIDRLFCAYQKNGVAVSMTKHGGLWTHFIRKNTVGRSVRRQMCSVPILFEDQFTKKILIGKCKIVPLLNEALLHESVWEIGGIPPYILNVSNRWRWVDIFMPWPLENKPPGTCWIEPVWISL